MKSVHHYSRQQAEAATLHPLDRGSVVEPDHKESTAFRLHHQRLPFDLTALASICLQNDRNPNITRKLLDFAEILPDFLPDSLPLFLSS